MSELKDSVEVSVSPVEEAIAAAMRQISSYQGDMIKVGISPQQFEAVGVAVQNRIKQEFEQREKEDPLKRIGQAIQEAAETPEEQKLAAEGVQRLEDFRKGWTKALAGAKQISEGANKPFVIREVVTRLRGGNLAPTFVDARQYATTDLVENYPSVQVLWGQQNQISPAFEERVLKAMGVLKPDQTLDSLRQLPPRKGGYRGPVFVENYGRPFAEHLPTNISGVDARVDFAQPGILLSMNLPTLARVVGLSES